MWSWGLVVGIQIRLRLYSTALIPQHLLSHLFGLPSVDPDICYCHFTLTVVPQIVDVKNGAGLDWKHSYFDTFVINAS